MTGRSGQEEASLPRDFYFGETYFERIVLEAFVTQILTVTKLNPGNILEIGKGNGFVSEFLKLSGRDVTTMDVNGELRPDLVGDIRVLDTHFQPNSFDLVMCFEVLEHMPFEDFESSLQKLRDVSSNWVVLSLPRAQRILIDVFTRLRIWGLGVFHPRFVVRRPSRKISETHHWEINHSEATTLKKIKAVLSKSFRIVNCFNDPRVRYHQYFVLQKI